MTRLKMTIAEFRGALEAQDVSRREDWAFKCPVCGTAQSMQSLINAGAGENADAVERWIAFSCVGRFTGAGEHKPGTPPGKGCNWTLGGLFQLHELEVIGEDGAAHPRFMPASSEEAMALAHINYVAAAKADAIVEGSAFVPTAWLDELTPEAQRDIHSFVRRGGNGQWLMLPAEEETIEDAMASGPFEVLQHHQVVAFTEIMVFGHHELRVLANGTWRADTVPSEANRFWLLDENFEDAIGDDIAELVRISNAGSPLDPGTYTMGATFESQYDVHFRFVVSDSGEHAWFERVEGQAVQ